jgi:hypothetical protein
VGKGKPVAAVVDAVLNGATLRVTLLDSQQSATVAVCGVACASMSKRAPVDGAPESDASAATAIGQPEPYAREAKFFSESRALNRWAADRWWWRRRRRRWSGRGRKGRRGRCNHRRRCAQPAAHVGWQHCPRP